MEDCIFCKIANKEVESQVVYEDENIIAFKDMSPQAPVHLLFIPKEHIKSAHHLPDDDMITSKIFTAIKKVAKDMDFAKDGYRIITNIGNHGGQTVEHLHYHVLAGRNLQWPPG